MHRRSFIKTAATVGAAISVAPNVAFGKNKKDIAEKVKIGFIGIGGRGRSHLCNVLKRTDVEIPAICDINPEAIEKCRPVYYAWG